MYNAFQDHEKKFEDWVAEGFPGIKEESRQFLENIRKFDRSPRLWKDQIQGINHFVYAYEILGMKNLLLNIVTGGGKTAIIAGAIAWLKMSHNINKFLIIVPNLIVRDRLEQDFSDKSVFKKFKFFPQELESQMLNELDLHTLESGSGPQGIMSSGIVLGNVQQLYTTNISGQRNLAFLSNYSPEIAIFNDEAHNTPALEYNNVLSILSSKCKFRMDTTATPDRADGQTPDSDMIYQYDISQALEDKIVKSIVVYEPEVKIVELTYTNPDTGEKKIVTDLEKEFKEAEQRIKPFQWILDPEPMKKQIALAMLRLQEQRRRAKDRYKPILFVVTMSIREGERAQKVLKDVFNVNTLLVTEESDEHDRVSARNIGKIDSPYDAVVSVMMLREGWDVPEVSVILLLRKFSSPVYGQQVIGRGLRRIIRDHEEPEILAVIDHPRLDHDWLWRLVAVSKIRQNVLPEEVFGDEDLPEKPKIQRLTKPENFIIIPSPEYETSIDFDKKKTEIPEDQIEDRWREKLESVEYDKNIWLISRTKVESVRASQLDKTRDMEVDYDTASIDQISVMKNGKNEVSLEELREIFKADLLSVASNLLIEAGFGGMKKGILYGAMMDHIKSKIFKGKSLSDVDRQDLEFALDNMQEIRKNFSKSVVSGILKGA
jgi:superfamily II DNA or RNA helicase